MWVGSAKRGRRTSTGRKGAHRAKRGKLSAFQKGRNTRITKVRARVEHVLVGLHHMGGQQIHTIGPAWVQLQIMMKPVVYNPER